MNMIDICKYISILTVVVLSVGSPAHAKQGKPAPSFRSLELAMKRCFVGQTDSCCIDEMKPYFFTINERILNGCNTIDNHLDARTQKTQIRDMQLVREKKAGSVLLEKTYMLGFTDGSLEALRFTFVKRGDIWNIQRFNYREADSDFWRMVGFD
jgi:hypothetical protein